MFRSIALAMLAITLPGAAALADGKLSSLPSCDSVNMQASDAPRTCIVRAPTAGAYAGPSPLAGGGDAGHVRIHRGGETSYTAPRASSPSGVRVYRGTGPTYAQRLAGGAHRSRTVYDTEAFRPAMRPEARQDVTQIVQIIHQDRQVRRPRSRWQFGPMYRD